MIHSVSITVVQPNLMRYRTVGDWQVSGGALAIQVADTGNWKYNILVGVHELVEVILCVNDGVSEKKVSNFDLAHQADDDPGTHPKAPYHKQHLIAMSVEMMLAALLGVKWRVYEDKLDEIYFKIPKRRKPL